MKLLNVKQIRMADKYTIENEPVASLDLMERAALKVYQYINDNFSYNNDFYVFCGKGNNGGDGFALARLLHGHHYHVKAFFVFDDDKMSDDCRSNMLRLKHECPQVNVQIVDLNDENAVQDVIVPDDDKNVIVDALFGSGLTRALSDDYGAVIDVLNFTKGTHLSVDVPSGLFCDGSTIKHGTREKIFRADVTLTFQYPKVSFFYPENSLYVGKIEVLDIGLSEKFYATVETDTYLIDKAMLESLFKSRKRSDHKGVFGHALLVAGSSDKSGAAVLAARSCMKSGLGLLSVDVRQENRATLNVAVPEAMSVDMTSVDFSFDKFNAIGIGPGLGTEAEAYGKLVTVLVYCHDNEGKTKLVIDADGLNLLGLHRNLFDLLPESTILTPHPLEFARMFGSCDNDEQRIEKQRNMSKLYRIIIVYKTSNTVITTPDGDTYINSTGNPGMATAGSGDVLTGLITGLLSRGYSPEEAAVIGVFYHGLSGDVAAKALGVESMNSSDIIENIKIGLR